MMIISSYIWLSYSYRLQFSPVHLASQVCVAFLSDYLVVSGKRAMAALLIRFTGLLYTFTAINNELNLTITEDTTQGERI